MIPSLSGHAAKAGGIGTIGTELIHDIGAIRKIREQIQAIRSTGEPTVNVLTSRGTSRPKKVGVLPGSFDPLTEAHAELARRAKKELHLDEILLSISQATTDKEGLTRTLLEDRLLALLACSLELDFGVAVASHGLFFEQALALRNFFGKGTAILFIIGYDKLLQIFDRKYYKNRRASLDQLFSAARLVVANRDDKPLNAIRDFLSKRENKNYARYVDSIWLSPPFSTISSTLVRNRVDKGAEIAGLVPEPIRRWITETGAYRSRRGEGVTVYELRCRAIEFLLQSRMQGQAGPELKALIQTALGNSTFHNSVRQALCKADWQALAVLFA